MATKGGKREGSGRKPGIPNRKTAEKMAAAAEAGLMPVDYMLNVMRDETAEKSRRDDMAKAVAPYLSPKLANIEVGNKGGAPFKVVVQATDGDL